MVVVDAIRLLAAAALTRVLENIRQEIRMHCRARVDDGDAHRGDQVEADLPAFRRIDVGVGGAGLAANGLAEVSQSPKLPERRVVRYHVGVRYAVWLGIEHVRIGRETGSSLFFGAGWHMDDEGVRQAERLCKRAVDCGQRGALSAEPDIVLEADDDLAGNDTLAEGAVGDRAARRKRRLCVGLRHGQRERRCKRARRYRVREQMISCG